MLHHRRVWNRLQASGDLNGADGEFHRAQYQRRMQTSALLTLTAGIMLMGNWLVFDKAHLLTFTAWVICLLLLTLWILLLGIGDWIAIRAHSQAVLAEIRMKQLALEREAEQLRRAHSGQRRGHSNGSGNGHSGE